MDKEYVYKDGKALLIDENNNQRVIDYYDNLEDVLSVEYLIAEMKENEKQLIDDINTLEKNFKFTKITKIFRVAYLFVVLAMFIAVVSPMMRSLYVLGEVEKVFFAFLVSFFSVPGLMISLLTFIQEKEDLRNHKGKKMQLDNLRKELLKQEKYVEELKNNKTNSNNTEEFYLKKIQDGKQDVYLEEFLKFYYNIGYDEDKYLEYYQRGNLDKKLDVDNDDWKQEVNEYFKQKNTCLKRVRKLNKKNRK